MSALAGILELLRQRAGEYVSGEEISGKLGISRSAVWKHINKMESAGYAIEAAPHLGYCLKAAPDILLPDEIRHGLATRRFGQKMVCFRETTSTNDRALELAASGEAEGLLVAAEAQTQGRGRRERKWLSKPGANLLFSLILRPAWTAEMAPRATLLLAVAVAQAIRSETGLAARIKWPNDILVDQAKVAGILTEMRAQADAVDFLVCGVGVNVGSAPAGVLRHPAASLAALAGKPVARLPLLRRILWETETRYDEMRRLGPEPMLQAWRNLALFLGTQIYAETPGQERREGMMMGVDETGALLLREESGLVLRMTSGETGLMRPQGKDPGR